MERKWGSDNFGSTAYKTAVIHDKDGSVGGISNSYILINDGVNDSIAADAQDCEMKPTWNAAVCKGDIGRLRYWRPRRRWRIRRLRRASPRRRSWRTRWSWQQRPVLAQRAGPAGPGGPGAAAGPGGAPARAGGFGGGPGAAPQPPVVLSRNGKDFNVTSSNVRAGTEIKVTTERPTVSLSLTELDKGSWVMFELPGFTKAASGTQESSLDALRKASDTSYFKDKDALWVKVVSNRSPRHRGRGTPWLVEPASRSAGKLHPAA